MVLGRATWVQSLTASRFLGPNEFIRACVRASQRMQHAHVCVCVRPIGSPRKVDPPSFFGH